MISVNIVTKLRWLYSPIRYEIYADVSLLPTEEHKLTCRLGQTPWISLLPILRKEWYKIVVVVGVTFARQ